MFLVFFFFFYARCPLRNRRACKYYMKYVIGILYIYIFNENIVSYNTYIMYCFVYDTREHLSRLNQKEKYKIKQKIKKNL